MYFTECMYNFKHFQVKWSKKFCTQVKLPPSAVRRRRAPNSLKTWYEMYVVHFRSIDQHFVLKLFNNRTLRLSVIAFHRKASACGFVFETETVLLCSCSRWSARLTRACHTSPALYRTTRQNTDCTRNNTLFRKTPTGEWNINRVFFLKLV